MTDLNGIYGQIEELLGTEGTRELAAALFPILKEGNYLSFSEAEGYTLRQISLDTDTWNSMLADAEAMLVAWKAGEVTVGPIVDPCGLCGEAYEDHRPASGNTAPFCMSRNSRTGDTFIRGAR